MIANREQCLETDALADLLAGRMPAERFSSLLEHVESCERCAQAAEAVAGQAGGGQAVGGQAAPAWLKQAFDKDARDPFDHEPECQAVVGNLLLQPNPRLGERDVANVPTESLGPYRLLKWLGSGGMGSVYLAEHQRLKRMAAIKLLPREKLLQAGWLERFNREMTSIAALEHPHVVRAIDAGDEAGWHFLVMEYLEGADLSKVCRRVGEIPLPTACELIRQAALGLGAIHALGMTHRDIKPSNLFLTRAGTVKLLDLGLVLSGDSPLATDERLTTVGHLMGTVPYMAREQLVDASSVDWRADIYSLGATLFRLLTGRAPFGPATNLAQTIQAISSTACPSLKSLKPDVPSEIAELVDRMLSHDPARRPQSADEVAQALTPFCDAAAPQALVRAAMNVSEDQEEYLSSQMQPNPLLVGTETKAEDGGTRSRWITWTAAAFLPLAFLAGILITVTTDKGTLVIESDEPGISVNVAQGDKVIESLRVEQGAKSVRLQSGKYLVELTGIESDGLEISDSQVLLTRGDKQVVKVHRKGLDGTQQPTTPSEPAGSSYQGKSFVHWMSVLENEKDVAMIAQAMQAVKLLAETDAQRADAARKCLIPARQLGGIYMSNRPESGISNDQPGWFMTELVESYMSFLPEPGMEAVIEEIETGNEKSASAVTVLLGCFRQGTANYGASTDCQLDDYLAELSANEKGRKTLARFDAALKDRIEKMPSPRFDIARRNMLDQRIMLLDALGAKIADHPQIVAFAKRLVSAGDEVIEKKESYRMNGLGGGMSGPDPRGINLGRSPLDSWTALMISRTLEGFPGKSVALGLLEPTAAELEPRVTETLARFAKDYPQETAAAIVAQLERTESPGMGMGAGVLEPVNRDARKKIAMDLLPTTTIDSISVVKALAKALAEKDPACIFGKAEIEEQLRQVGLRMAKESLNVSDPNREEKGQRALFIFAQLGLPYVIKDGVRQYDQAACDLVLSQPRSDIDRYSIGTNLPAWPNILNDEWTWSPRLTRIILERLMAQYPSNMLTAYANSLQKMKFDKSSTVLINSLLVAMNAKTPKDQRLGSEPRARDDYEPQVLSMTKFLEMDGSKPVIEELERAHQKALESQQKLLEFADLQSLLYSRLVIASYLGRDAAQEAAVLDALRTLVNVQQKRGTPSKTLSLGLLFIASDKLGYDQIPFPAFQAAAQEFDFNENCDRIKQLVKGLHDSRPEEFCEFFTADLERMAQFLASAKARNQARLDQTAMMLYGGLNATCEGWYREIVQRLLDNPKTKERAIVALQSIIQYLPAESTHLLESLLPKD